MHCTKTSFANEENADFYIKKLKATSYRKKKPVRSYLCPNCLNWHITSQTDKDKEYLQGLHDEIRRKNEQITHLAQIIHKLKTQKKNESRFNR